MRVAATSVNPIDCKRRAGLTKDFYLINFPGLMGVDTAGTVVMALVRSGRLSRGDRVFAMAADTYAELCIVKAAILAKVPKGLDLIQAAVLPLLTTIGNQLISATGIKAARTVLVTGAAECRTFGGIHREGTRRNRDCGGFEASDGRKEDSGRGEGGRNRRRHRDCESSAAKPDMKTLQFMAEAVRDGKLVIPISQKLPLREAAKAQAAAEKGGIGKILLVA